MAQSESIKNLMGALLEARGKMAGAKKSANNPHFKSKYASLESIIEAVDAPLRDAGINFMQLPVEGERVAGVRTVLYHVDSGEWIDSELLMPLGKPGPQEIGSMITYAKRYTLQAMCGLPSEDDDGESAQQHYRKAKPTGQPETVAQTTVNESLGDNFDWAAAHDYTSQIREALHLNDDTALFQLVDELAGDNDMKVAVWNSLTKGRDSEKSLIERKLKEREPTSSTLSTI